MSICKLIGAAIVALCMSSAHAVSLSLVYTGGSSVDEPRPADGDGAILANNGDVLTFELIMDFSDWPTIGGGFDINFDAAGLSFLSYQSAGLGDPDFGRDPDVEDGRLFSGAFGSFNGLVGPDLVATIQFVVDGVPFADPYDLSPGDTTGPGGPFIAFDVFDVLHPEFSGESVRVVPIPPALWLLTSGLCALAGLKRRKSA